MSVEQVFPGHVPGALQLSAPKCRRQIVEAVAHFDSLALEVFDPLVEGVGIDRQTDDSPDSPGGRCLCEVGGEIVDPSTGSDGQASLDPVVSEASLHSGVLCAGLGAGLISRLEEGHRMGARQVPGNAGSCQSRANDDHTLHAPSRVPGYPRISLESTPIYELPIPVLGSASIAPKQWHEFRSCPAGQEVQMWCMLMALSAGAMDYQWVQADVLNLRVAPESGSLILARARIGTGVEVMEERGGWKRVRLVGRPADYPVEGWVSGDYLGSKLDAAAYRELSIRAEDPNKACAYLERALVVDGADPTHWDEVAECRGRGSNVEGAAEARARASGDVTMWIGVCDGNRVELVGRVDPGGEARGVEGATLDDLAIASWYTGDRPVLGTPFATPFLTNNWNEQEPSAWRPNPETEMGDHAVVLGPCTARGVVYSTLPLSPRQQRAASVRDASNFLDDLPQASTLFGLRVRRPMADEKHIEVQLVAPMEWHTCGGIDLERHQATGIALLDESGESVLEFGGPWFDSHRGHTPVSVSSPRWFTTLAGQRLLISDAEWYMSSGVTLAVERAENWDMHHQVLRTWGC